MANYLLGAWRVGSAATTLAGPRRADDGGCDERTNHTPWIRHRNDPDGVVDHFRSLADHDVPDRADTVVERILVDGGDAMVLGEIRQTARPTAGLTTYQEGRGRGW